MPLYINDAEVSQLADELAANTGVSKTEIVRRLLREESRRIERLRTADERIGRLNEISRKAAAIAREMDPPFTYEKRDADAMFEYLEPDRKPPIKSPFRRKPR